MCTRRPDAWTSPATTRAARALGGELVRGGVIVGEHDRVTAGVVGGPPAGETVTVCLRLRAAVDAAVPRERLEAGMVTATQLGQRVGFPRLGEAMRFVELDGAEGVGERGEHAAGRADGAELLMVADQHEFGAMTAQRDRRGDRGLGWRACRLRRRRPRGVG